MYTFDEFAGWRRMFSGCEEHQGGRVRQSARGWFFEIGSGRPFLGTCGSNTVPVEAAPDCEAGCARCQEWGRRQSSKLVPGRRCGRHRASIVPALGRQCARKSWVHTVALCSRCDSSTDSGKRIRTGGTGRAARAGKIHQMWFCLERSSRRPHQHAAGEQPGEPVVQVVFWQGAISVVAVVAKLFLLQPPPSAVQRRARFAVQVWNG